MSGDLSLFGDDEPEESPAQAVPVSQPIAEWQVDLIRKALDARGLETMPERQSVIEEHAGRPVASLRALTHDEALGLLSRLGQSRSGPSRMKSAWDERGEDTWIDRL